MKTEHLRKKNQTLVSRKAVAKIRGGLFLLNKDWELKLSTLENKSWVTIFFFLFPNDRDFINRDIAYFALFVFQVQHPIFDFDTFATQV